MAICDWWECDCAPATTMTRNPAPPPPRQARAVESRNPWETSSARHACSVLPGCGQCAMVAHIAGANQPLSLTIITGFVHAHGQVAPARHPLQADRDDELFGDLHRRQLAVPRVQQLLRAIMLRPGAQDLGP